MGIGGTLSWDTPRTTPFRFLHNCQWAACIWSWTLTWSIFKTCLTLCTSQKIGWQLCAAAWSYILSHIRPHIIERYSTSHMWTSEKWSTWQLRASAPGNLTCQVLLPSGKSRFLWIAGENCPFSSMMYLSKMAILHSYVAAKAAKSQFRHATKHVQCHRPWCQQRWGITPEIYGTIIFFFRRKKCQRCLWGYPGYPMAEIHGTGWMKPIPSTQRVWKDHGTNQTETWWGNPLYIS